MNEEEILFFIIYRGKVRVRFEKACPQLAKEATLDGTQLS